MNGKGTYFFKDGRKLIAIWKDDLQQGSGDLYDLKGNKVTYSPVSK
jgi:hypothetical protein